MEVLWQKIKPFYEEIHAYVRFKLRKQYGNDLISENGPMPAHIFGNMWSQSWAAIYDHVVPYPDAGVRPDATEGPGHFKGSRSASGKDDIGKG